MRGDQVGTGEDRSSNSCWGDISEALPGFMEPIERPGRVRLTMSGKSAYTPTDSPTPVCNTVTWRTWIASHPHLPPLSC